MLKEIPFHNGITFLRDKAHKHSNGINCWHISDICSFYGYDNQKDFNEIIIACEENAVRIFSREMNHFGKFENEGLLTRQACFLVAHFIYTMQNKASNLRQKKARLARFYFMNQDGEPFAVKDRISSYNALSEVERNIHDGHNEYELGPDLHGFNIIHGVRVF